MRRLLAPLFGVLLASMSSGYVEASNAVTVSIVSVSFTDEVPDFSLGVFERINYESKEISDFALGWFDTGDFRMIVVPDIGGYHRFVLNPIGEHRVSDEKIELVNEIIEARMFALQKAEARGEHIRSPKVAPLDEFFRTSGKTKDLPDRRVSRSGDETTFNKALEGTP